ncbi:MAG: TrmH family RNA methyltransferase [Gemmatimonadales bacterium]
MALLEPRTPEVGGRLARRCAQRDASLHLIAPQYPLDDPAFRESGPDDWNRLDWWVHPGWRDFRDAISRERCLYFSADADRDPADAPFRPNSVLVFGTEEFALPERIVEKYPDRIFALPRGARSRRGDPAAAVEATVAFAAQRIGG